MPLGPGRPAALSCFRRFVPSPHPTTGGAMTLDSHIEALRTRHRSLDTEINREAHQLHPDDKRIADLKRKKLHIKDELVHLEHER